MSIRRMLLAPSARIQRRTLCSCRSGRPMSLVSGRANGVRRGRELIIISSSPAVTTFYRCTNSSCSHQWKEG